MLCSFRARAVDADGLNDDAERYKDALEPTQGALRRGGEASSDAGRASENRPLVSFDSVGYA